MLRKVRSQPECRRQQPKSFSRFDLHVKEAELVIVCSRGQHFFQWLLLSDGAIPVNARPERSGGAPCCGQAKKNDRQEDCKQELSNSNEGGFPPAGSVVFKSVAIIAPLRQGRWMLSNHHFMSSRPEPVEREICRLRRRAIRIKELERLRNRAARPFRCASALFDANLQPLFVQASLAQNDSNCGRRQRSSRPSRLPHFPRPIPGKCARPIAESAALFQNFPVRHNKDGSRSAIAQTPRRCQLRVQGDQSSEKKSRPIPYSPALQYRITLFDQRHHFMLQKIRIAFSLGVQNFGSCDLYGMYSRPGSSYYRCRNNDRPNSLFEISRAQSRHLPMHSGKSRCRFEQVLSVIQIKNRIARHAPTVVIGRPAKPAPVACSRRFGC